MGLPMRREHHDLRLRTTAEPIDMQAFCEGASVQGGELVLKAVYAHASEIISNVYQHAAGSEKQVVEWFFTCFVVGNHFQVSVEDNGIGLFESLRVRYGSEVSLETLLQPPSRSLTHRGMGLAELLSDFHAGRVSSVIFQSPAGTVEMGKLLSDFAPEPIAQGTRVVFTVPFGNASV